MERKVLNKAKLEYSNKYTDAEREFRFVVLPLTFLKSPNDSERKDNRDAYINSDVRKKLNLREIL